MWRLLLVVAVMGLIASTCSGEGLSAQEELAELVAKFGERPHTVTYQVDSVSEGEPSSGRSTVYSDGASRRVDHEFEKGSSISISTEDTINRCSVPARTCFSFGSGGSLNPAFGLDAYAGVIPQEGFVLAKASDRSVSGVSADCFLFANDEIYEPHTEICLAEDGLFVYGRSGGPGTIAEDFLSTTEAVEIVRSVPEGIFDQPYPLDPCNDGLGSPGCAEAGLEE